MTTEPPLPRRAEALLRDFTKDPDRDWDAQARAITEQLGQVALGSTPDELLAIPALGVEPGEPMEPAGAAENQASGSPLSLSELARSIAQKPRTAHEALLKQSLATAAAARATPQTPKAATPAAVPAPSPGAAPQPSAAQPPVRERSSLRSFLAGAGVAIAAGIAATVMRPSSQPATPVAAETTPAATAAVPALPQKPAVRTVEPPSEEQARTDVPTAETKAAPAPEPAASPEAAAPRAEPPAPAVAAKPLSPAPAPAPAAPAKAKRAATASEPVVLEDAMATAAGPAASAPKIADESARLRPASAATSNTVIVERPSPGAAQAAIGSVLGAARACVAGLTGASNANVVFNAEGGVSKVTLSGPAAGTPAGQCVESALRRARVAPFSQPSYVVSGIAIRP